MVKTRQKNFRAFVFVEGQEQETLAYVQKNLGFLRKLLLVFAYPLHEGSTLLQYLRDRGLKFVQSDNVECLGLEMRMEQHIEADIPITPPIEGKKTLVLHRTIRSGEEVITQGDLTIFGRINSGSHIQSGGNLQIFGAVSGNVLCEGDYMILGAVSEGNVLFGGEIVQTELLRDSYHKIYRKNHSIVVEELS